MRAVVVDDEAASREAVLTLLGEVPEVEVVGEARSGTEALAVVRAARPDLLFLDVQMPGLDGFDVLEALGTDVPRGVILVTAHGEYALRAFDVHAVDYVTKPFGRPRFIAAVHRALRRLDADEALHARPTLESVIASLRERPPAELTDDEVGTIAREEGAPVPARARIGVRLGSRTTLVDVDAIDWAEVDGDLARLHVGGQTHLLRSSLTELGRTLGDDTFARIHRGVLVNRERVRVLHREPDGSGSVELDSGVVLRVARGRWDQLEAMLGLRSKG